jgi:hypothetical protein
MIAALGVNRAENADICCKTHQTIVVTRREVDIGDTLVERRRWVHRKLRRPIDLFVWTHSAKGAPIG